MAKPRGIRRFLRFSLRSLLLVTLAVAAWLGYEVHDARTVERRAAAIRALGGEVEFEPSPWSLLRFFEPGTYGRRIVIAEVPGETVEDALPQLKSLPRLRELRVVFEGTFDQRPLWRRLNSSLPHADVLPIAPKEEPPPEVEGWLGDWLVWNTPGYGTRKLPESRTSQKRCQRFLEKIEHQKGTPEMITGLVKEWTSDSPKVAYWHDYQALRLPNGALAELLIISLEYGGFGHFVVLLVDDDYVDAWGCYVRGGHLAIQDVDGDAYLELTIEAPALDFTHDQAQAIPGDRRKWWVAYAIEPSGFRNLLPIDPGAPQSPESEVPRAVWILGAHER